MPATILDCAGRAPASTALSLHSATRSQLTCLLNVSQSGVALPLPAALQNAPRLAHAHDHFGLRRQSASVDGAFTSFRNPLPADLSPHRKPKRRGAPASRRTPKRPPARACPRPLLDCAGRAPASTALSLHSATRSQLTGLLNVSQSGVALPLPAALQNAPRLAHAHDDFGLRRQSASVDGAFTSFRNPLPADWSPQRKPKRRGAPASRRTPKRPPARACPRPLWTAPAERQRRRRFHFLPQPAPS